jgi:hexokinase
MEVSFVGSIPITVFYLVTDEHYLLLCCLHCLSDVVGFIFGVGVNDCVPKECLTDFRFPMQME